MEPVDRSSTAALRFGIIAPFGSTRNAEFENIERIRLTAAELGLECYVLKPDGTLLDGPIPGGAPPLDRLDFVITLHFLFPKSFDCFTYAALWNPVAYYYDWGYETHSQNLVSFDDYLTCSSPATDDHIARLLRFDRTRKAPIFTFYHSLSNPIIPPAERRRKLFYCGVNWEKRRGTPGRHDDLFRRLDASDLIELYGPRTVGPAEPWKGFRNYRGEIPFDGTSVVRKIAECGASLVLSSAAHKASALMSNRLFESCAAGAVIIADENPFVRRFFGDAVLYVDSSQSSAGLYQAISSHLVWINEDAGRARELAEKSQGIFLERFSLASSLKRIVEGHHERKNELESLFLKSEQNSKVACFAVIPDLNTAGIERCIENVRRQTYRNIHLKIIVDRGIFAERKGDLAGVSAGIDLEFVEVERLAQSANGAAGEVCSNLGSIMGREIRNGAFDAFFFLYGNEFLFKHHVSALLRALEEAPGAVSAMSDYLLESHSLNGSSTYSELRSKRMDPSYLPKSLGEFCAARYIFSSSALTGDLDCWVHALDLLLPAFLSVSRLPENGPAYSHRATASIDAAGPALARRLETSPDREIIRDYVRGKLLVESRSASDAMLARDLLNQFAEPSLSRISHVGPPSVLSRSAELRFRLMDAVRRARAMLPGGRRLVLFGCGSAGAEALHSLGLRDRVVCFADNSASWQGKRFFGYPVIAPDRLASCEFDLVLIASAYYSEIHKQLLQLGVPASRILRWK